ncbi:MAG: amidohydrolase family protein, partial [Anaerolineales bacterium]|nr:amidohydrolase family protein [Anaerolineales bacterium]
GVEFAGRGLERLEVLAGGVDLEQLDTDGLPVRILLQRLLEDFLGLRVAPIGHVHIGLGDRVGSLEAGKQADLLLVDTGDYRHLAYEFGGNPVETVIKRGAIVYARSGRHP